MKICKFYVNGNCKEQNCKFNHIDNICKNYFFNGCLDLHCQLIHKYKLNKNNNSKKVNTECYDPSYKPHDMVVKLILNKCDVENLSDRDVFLCPNLFLNENDLYNQLLNEINNTGIKDIFKLWHGDTHYIADDHLKWKKNCPTFNYIIDKISKYFDIQVKATRFNLYKNSNEFKPYHFDAAAFDPEKSKIQNITIGVSFGITREIAFEHAIHKNTVSFPLSNGMIYGFNKQINLDWRHGIPAIHPDNYNDNGRISIIIWGATNSIKT